MVREQYTIIAITYGPPNVVPESSIVSQRNNYYNGRVDRFLTFFFLATPISSPGCEYAFGVYAESHECSTSYIKCAYGEPHQQNCEPGLAYDDRLHGCNWPDQLLEICNPEGITL